MKNKSRKKHKVKSKLHDPIDCYYNLIYISEKIYHFAYFKVKSLALLSAAFLFDFHSAAASLLRGSSGFGSASKD